MTFIIGTPHTHNAGYFRNDDTPSGGLKTEADVQTCPHCQAIIKMQEWRQDGAWCGKCNKPICSLCGARMVIYGCEPFLKQLETHLGQLGRFEQFLADTQQTSPAVAHSQIITGQT